MSSQEKIAGDDCDFGDQCEGELKETHKALADIARNVEAAGGNCDGDEGIPDVIRGVRSFIDCAKEEAELARRAPSEREKAREAVIEAAKFLRDELNRIAPMIIRSPGFKALDARLSALGDA